MQKFYFRQCTATLLDRTFGLRQTFSDETLSNWLNAEDTISEAEKAALTIYQELLVLNDTVWNEQELALLCIGPMFATVHLTEPYRYNLFAGRRISALLSTDSSEIELSGEPDGIIATGFREPEVPFFTFTEYKRQLDPDGDPKGQTLAAMLVAQALNGHRRPVYGAYVIGSDWRFMVLSDRQYTISCDYSALSDEIFDILRILKGLKQIVMRLTA